MQELLRTDEVKKHFPLRTGLSMGLGRRGVVKAVDGVTLKVMPGETLAIVGESGSGKTTLGRLIMGLTEPTSGRVIFDGVELGKLSPKEMKKLRGDIQMIFQDPTASLPPHLTIGGGTMRAVKLHSDLTGQEQRARVHEILERVGLRPSSKDYDRYPSQISGGERQRAVIARALVSRPRFIVADEPVAMLDVSVRAQIIELLRELREDMNLTSVLISHDLSVAGYLCDRIAIMYLGRIVEIGATDEIFSNPQHPYTVALRSSIPIPDPKKRRIGSVAIGEAPNPASPPSGCHFHPRCAYAVDSCKTEIPAEVQYSETHYARCPVKPFSAGTAST